MHSGRIIIYIALVVLISPMVLFTGCHRGESVVSQRDSTQIKRIEAMQQRGSEFRDNSDFESAIAVHDSCVQMAESIHDTIQLVMALNNLGTDYRRLSANKEASEYHIRALELCDAYSDTTTFLAKKNLVRSLNGLGNILMSLGDYDVAEKIFRRALDGETKLNSATGQAINLANIGSIKSHKRESDSARIYYNRSMEKNREDNNTIGMSLCYAYLGEMDYKAGHTSNALSNYRQAYSIGCTTGDIWHMLTPCLSLAKIYTEQFEVDSARSYINIGIESARKIHSNEHLRDFYAIRSSLEEKKGNTAQALADLRLCTSYNDSVVDEEERSSVQNARANYEASRRSVEVQAANENAATSRMVRDIVIFAAVFIVALMCLAFWLYRRYQRIRHKAERDREVFVRNITHQLRTPMTVVTGMVSQLKDHIPADDTVGRESLEATERQSRKLQELIMQLARMSKNNLAPLLNEQGDINVTGTGTGTGTGTITGTITGTGTGTGTMGDGRETWHAVAKAVRPETVGKPLTIGKDTTLPVTTETEDESFDMDNPRILLAEDTADVAMMMCSLLCDHGYAVARAADGQEALEFLQKDLPDLLITDIAMPRMDGLELMRHVREDDTMCHLPIIVASARVEDSERMEGISAGAEVYLTKPFIPEELLLRVRMLLMQRERLRRSFGHVAVENVAKEDANATTVKEITESTQANNVVVEEGRTDEVFVPQMSESEKSFIDSLNRCIDDNMLSGDVNISFIADKLCMSQSTLHRKIKNITDMPMATYIRTRRMVMAKKLLTTTDKSIAEIEVLCGFNTPGHFSRLFKAETGMSPREYRQRA